MVSTLAMTDLNSQSTPVAEHELSPVSTSTSIVQALKQKRAQLMTGFPSSKSGFGRRIFSKLSEIDLNKIKTMVETRMMMKKAKRVFRFLDLPRELRDVVSNTIILWNIAGAMSPSDVKFMLTEQLCFSDLPSGSCH